MTSLKDQYRKRDCPVQLTLRMAVNKCSSLSTSSKIWATETCAVSVLQPRKENLLLPCTAAPDLTSTSWWRLGTSSQSTRYWPLLKAVQWIWQTNSLIRCMKQYEPVSQIIVWWCITHWRDQHTANFKTSIVRISLKSLVMHSFLDFFNALKMHIYFPFA